MGSLILVSFVLRREDSSWHHPSCRSAVLAAAGQRMPGCSGLAFLSAMIPLLALRFVKRKQTQCLELLLEREDVWGATGR